MIWVLERVSGPEFEPVTLAEAKRHLRMFDSNTDEDDDVTGLIQGAREWVEDYTGRILVEQEWRLTVDQTGVLTGDSVGGYRTLPGYYAGQLVWADRLTEIALRKSPVIALTSFVTVGSDGAETAVTTGTYQLREGAGRYPRIVPLSGGTWGVGNFRITFRAGYANTTGSPQDTATSVPNRYKQAMKLWIEAMYDRGAEMQSLLDAAAALVEGERVHTGIA